MLLLRFFFPRQVFPLRKDVYRLVLIFLRFPGIRVVSQQCFQRPLHIPRAGIPVIRSEFACLQHNSRQGPARILRRRQLFSAQPAGDGALPHSGGDVLRRDQRKPVTVQKPVKGNAEGIKIRPVIIGGSVHNFRSHIVRRPLLRQSLGQGFKASGYAEVAQLVVHMPGGFIVDKDVGRFNVPVNDMLLFAKIQRTADINAKPDHFNFRQHALAQYGIQRLKQLHADKDVIADAVFLADHLIVFDADDIGCPFEILHQVDLGGIFPGDGVIIALALGKIHSFRKQGCGFPFALRNGNDLQGGVNGRAVFPDNPVNR